MENSETSNIVLQRILKNVSVKGKTEVDKILTFYRTSVELERLKEPEIKDFYKYPINFIENGNDDTFLIDLPCNKDFLRMYCDNTKDKWPKDLYVGLSVQIENTIYRLLSTVINYDDFKEFQPEDELLPIRIKDLTVDTRDIEDLQLSPDDIDKINDSIKKVSSFKELQQTLINCFGETTTAADTLSLALCQKNPALSQISSELKSLNSTLIKKHPLLNSLLTSTRFVNKIDNIVPFNLLRVCNMDESQLKVVAHALNNRLTVVTGAPGTGKTQVILNILANALIRGKSVLVASKNNKAVDNVKDRFDKIDESGYMLRFGAKSLISQQTLPAINGFRNKIKTLQESNSNLDEFSEKYKTACTTNIYAIGKLVRMQEIEGQIIPSLQKETDDRKNEVENENKFHEQKIKEIQEQHAGLEAYNDITSEQLESFLSNIRNIKNDMQIRYSGLSKIWHNWFHVKKDARVLLNCIEQFPHKMKTHIFEKEEVFDDVKLFQNGDAIIEKCDKVMNFIKRILAFVRLLHEEEKRHTNASKNLSTAFAKAEKKYNEANAELSNIKSEEESLHTQVQQSYQTIADISKDYIKAAEIELLKQPDAIQNIARYSYYLEDSIQWKRENMDIFSRASTFIDVFKLIAVTSLSVKGSFPMQKGLFDILIIDEASQCDIASAIPLIYRAKQVVVIGDPMQLKHITAVSLDEETAIKKHVDVTKFPFVKYVEKSLWDYCADALTFADQNNETKMLEIHYRCHHDIINYSNEMFYGQYLQRLKVETDEKSMSMSPQGIVWIDTIGKQYSNNVNVNYEEVNACISLATRIHNQYPTLSIGIITPFRQQAEMLNRKLPGELKEIVDANTVHKFQGDEKDVIIYSLVVTDNSPASKINWIDNAVPNLVNVAVTRARQTLFVVGNSQYIKKMSKENQPLGYLARCPQLKKYKL